MKMVLESLDTSITKCVWGLYSQMHDEEHHRYLSWEHCYKFFSDRPSDIEQACLHLAFYLASWGMYRGSSFLLQKDYLVHQVAVVEILKPKYHSLHGITLEDFDADSAGEKSDMILELVRLLKASYSGKNVTDTLATKILMGTLGCIPAYDRYFVSGLHHEGLPYSRLNKKNFSALLKYYHNHAVELQMVQKRILDAGGMRYPVMRLIDMHLWTIGQSSDGLVIAKNR